MRCFSPGSTSETDGDLHATAGILAGRPPPPAVTHHAVSGWGAESFSLSVLRGAKIEVPEPCAFSADVHGARRFENTGLYHVPKLHGELDGAGDPLRGCRGPGWRTGSSSLSMKRCSSSTFSRGQARCRSSACAARAEAGGSHDSFVLFLIVVRITPQGSIVSVNEGSEYEYSVRGQAFCCG